MNSKLAEKLSDLASALPAGSVFEFDFEEAKGNDLTQAQLEALVSAPSSPSSGRTFAR